MLSVDPITISLQDGLNGYQGTRDTSIRGDVPTTNYGSKAKLEMDGSPDEISLIRWDLASIPSSSTVTAASLTLNVTNTSPEGYEIYKALRAWDEMTATYQRAANGQPWEVPGAAGSTDRAGDVLGTVTGPSLGLVTIQLNALGVAMIQNWLTNPSSNLGIVIQDLNNLTTNGLDVSSSEATPNSTRPKLTITYVSTPAAPTVTVDTVLTNDPTPPLSGTVSNPGATISVTVAGQTKGGENLGNGTWTLADNQLTPLAQGVYNVAVTATAGNVGSDATTNELTVDLTLPVLTSFTRQSPASSPTNADVLIFRATFEESVRNVGAGDFAVTGTSAAVTNVNAVNPGTYDVTVSGGDLAGLNGTVGLNLASGQDIADLAGNTLPGIEPTTDQQYVVDNTVPSTPIAISLQNGLNGYQGTRDTSTRGDTPTANYGSRTKMELDGSPDQVGLIHWDMAPIPSSSTVISVSLTVNVVNTSPDGYEIYKALRAWDEMTATHQLAANGQPWEVPGAAGTTDHAGEVLGALAGPSLGLVTIQLNLLGVAMVQDWISNPSSNFGIVIQDLNNKTSNGLDISSREQSGLGPKLTVTYTPGTPPPANGMPHATNDSYSVNEDASLSVSTSQGVLTNDTDPEGSTLTANRISGPSNGTLILNPNGSFVYTPNGNFSGVDSFTYRAEDGALHGGEPTDVGTVTISIAAQQDNPLAVDDSITTTRNTSQSFNVLSNDSDPDGDSITVSSHTQPSHGTLSQNNGTFTYVPDNDYTGSDGFSYTIRDATGRTAIAAVLINVTGALTPITFRAMGDVPYSSGEYEALRNDLANVGSNDLFFMHVGDIKSGSSSCTSSVYSGVADVLLSSTKTVFIVPGDNEWNDCSNPSQAWGYWSNSFSRFDQHWTNGFTISRQSQRDENFAFVYGGVLFIGLNLVGGRVHDSQEWAQRMTDNSQWVSDNFTTYGNQISAAVVFGHAYPDGARQAFGTAFVDAAKKLAKPVLYLMGDLHSWKLDHPFSGAPNITRVIVDQGVPSVRVTVTQDPVNPFVFDRTP